eukprot:jgi/Chlat1/3077/Chrsp21S03323
MARVHAMLPVLAAALFLLASSCSATPGIVTTIKSYGLSRVYGVAADKSGAGVYVSDLNCIKYIRLSDGFTRIIAGSPNQAGFADGKGSSARFNLPTQLVLSYSGYTLYLLDVVNNAVRAIDLSSSVVRTVYRPSRPMGFLSLTVTKDEKIIYVSYTADKALLKLYPATGKAVRLTQSDFDCQARMGQVDLSPDEKYVFTPDQFMNELTCVDASTGACAEVEGVNAATLKYPFCLRFTRSGTKAIIGTTFANYQTVQVLYMGTGSNTNLAGLYGSAGHRDGGGKAARFQSIRDLDISRDERFVYVADDKFVRRVGLV